MDQNNLKEGQVFVNKNNSNNGLTYVWDEVNYCFIIYDQNRNTGSTIQPSNWTEQNLVLKF